MNHYRVAAIPGDGIGKEILPEGVRILDFMGKVTNQFKIDWRNFPWSCDYYQEFGRMMPDNGLEILENFDAIYFGAAGWPTVPDAISLWQLRLAICQGFEQYANVRPTELMPGVPGPSRIQNLLILISWWFEKTRKVNMPVWAGVHTADFPMKWPWRPVFSPAAGLNVSSATHLN